jgi:soluble lytic murein transglycosylase-like protein
MAYAGGIGQEIDQLKDLSVQELVRRQKLDPSLIYTIALQERQKMDAAGARQGVLGEPKPQGTVTGRMEQELAQQTMPQSPLNRVAPGVMQQGQRSMQPRGPQMAQGPQTARGISGVPATNMGAIGRAGGGIIEYANGGMLSQAQIPTTGAQQAAPATPEQIAAFQARLKELNEAKANAFPQEKAMFQQQIQDLLATTPAAIRNAVGGAGMARGGVVGYAPGGEVNMDALLDALMLAESGGDANAVSSAGAEGAYQIMPSTAEQPGFGVSPMKGDRFDPEASRAFARQYLQAMIDRYDGDIEAGLIAYNAGAGNADKFIAANRDYEVLPQTMQTQPYVRKVMGQLEKEERRRDFQLGGGRTISTTADESYTERTRRERLEKQEAALASLYPPVAMEEAEMYEPNLPDALAVAQAMDSLKGGAEEVPVIAGFPTREETDKAFTDAGLSGYGDGSRIRQRARTGPEVEEVVEEETRELTFGGDNNITTTLPEGFTEQRTRERREANAPAEGIAGYLQNIGRQQQLRRDNFRKAVPGAEAAVARAEQEKADGGIGYLRRLGRLQEEAAERQAKKERQALESIFMLQRNNDDVMGIDPAEKGTGQAYTQQTMPTREFQSGGGVKRFNGEDKSFIDTLRDRQRSGYEATEAAEEARQAAGDKIPMEDYMPDFGNIVRGQMENAAEDPLNYAANAILTFYGGPALIRGGATVLGPIIKKFGTKQGPALFQKAKDLALRATTKPNPKAVYPKGVKAGDLTKAGKPYKPLPVKGPSGQTAVPRTVVDPVKVGVGTGLAIKAGDALFNGDDEATEPTNAVEYLQDIGRKQEEAGTIEAFRAKRRAEEAAQRNRPLVKTGIAGALDKAKPLGGLALRLAEVLGRGAGASEGFEGAKILEESSRLRSEEAAIQLRRDQIAATTGQTEIRANATVDAMIGKAVADYTQGLTGGYLAAITAKAAELGVEEGDPKVSAAVIKDYVTMLRSTMGSSMQGLGGSGGLPEDVASAQAYLAETS